MISPRMILSTAATLALLVPAMAPTASLAQQHQGRGGVAAGGGAHVGGGGGHMGGGAHFGGGGGARMGGGATMGGGARVGGAAPQQFNAGAGAAGPRVAAGAATTQQFNGGQRFSGGERFNGGQRFSGGERFNGGDRGYRRGGGGWIPGAVAGAAVGGAIASGGYGYGYNDYGPSYAYYNGPEYYDDQYDDGGAVAVVPGVSDDSAGYCAQRYQSYDPASGTYLGFDGLRHPCP